MSDDSNYVQAIFLAYPRLCGVITHGDDALTCISYLAIAVLRVYSIWGRDWKLLLLAVPVCFYSAFTLIVYVPSSPSTPVKNHNPVTVSTSARSASIFSAGVITLLTWIRTFAIVRHTWKAGTPMPLATLLLRDGTVYFLLILAFQIIQLSTSVFGDGTLSVWPYFNQVLLVIVHSRFMIGLRGLYFADRGAAESEPTAHWSSINFHSVSASVVGNLGATLDLATVSDDRQRNSLTTPQDAVNGHIDSGSDWEDEAPEYCNDPFTTGMKDTESCEGAAEATQDPETKTV
ncbi:uncharacterized protein TRAVEDRAFT_51929 [Trametes versicolor FP-101664 SS1]|uniref:uncharacterized protein n=1 Tax=Trametes versicolor (strain FP-101664) TaxID=717944 RepID=UPI0004623845|nr:uncharacterized protein TRAVEDRAFT_51929 [Trametes versicolor FP-101664 SS1]EIW54212.1 hypothetical protein TRAVEDRAFT_51929 [Trametes versicolor FP-101664 SS1]